MRCSERGYVMSEKEKGLFDNVIDSAKKFNIAGIPGLTIDKAVKNFTETGSAMLSKEDVQRRKTEE